MTGDEKNMQSPPSAAQAAAVADTVDYAAIAAAAGEEPTREERVAMAMAMKANCESLSTMLQRMVDHEQEMKIMCAEFLIRDIEEENQRIALTRRCLNEQQATARSAAYVKWAHEKGLSDSAYGVLPPSAGDDGAAPSHADYEYHTNAPDTAFMKLEVNGVTLPQNLFHCSKLLVQRLMGWRKNASAKADAELDAMAAAREEAMREEHKHFLVALNGRLITPRTDATDAAALKQLEQFTTAFIESRARVGADGTDQIPTQRRDDAAWLYLAWREWHIAEASVSPLRELLSHPDAVASLLRDDGTDVITLVPIDAVSGGLTFTAVLLGTRIIAAETPLPEVKLDAVLGITLANAVAVLQSALDAGAAAMGVQPNELRLLNCVATKRHSATPTGVTIVGSSRLTPSSKLDRFEWSDLCGVARMNKESASPVEPMLRYTKHTVAELEPFDAYSAQWFPHLTVRHDDAPRSAAGSPVAPIQAAPAGVVITSPQKDAAAPSSTLPFIAVVAGTAAACLAVGVLLGRRQHR
jgi:hypothetical protein